MKHTMCGKEQLNKIIGTYIMAIKINTTYSGRTDNTDTNYPYGKGRNVVGGVEGTGTPFEAQWYNNLEGFLQGLLLEAGITPDGQVDNANSSQLVEAVKGLGKSAGKVSTKTDESVQDFIDTFALKIFQSPTDEGLTEIQTRTVGAGEVYEVRKTSDDSLATIYSDADGTTEVVQNGTSNVSDSAGVVEFYIADGDYYVEVSGVKGGLLVSSLKPFLTVADMTSASYLSKYAEGTRIKWQGYYTQSDGGSNWGVLKIGAHTADGGSIFSIDANTYIEANLRGKRLNVIKFGAIGDGVTDDTIAIQAALNTGRFVVFPEGVYIVSSKLYATNSIVGYGAVLDNSHLTPDTYGENMRILHYESVTDKKMIVIKGLGFYSGYLKPEEGDFDPGVVEQGHHIYITQSANIIVSEISSDSPYGDNVYLGSLNGPTPCKNIIIEKSNLFNPRRCNVACVSVEDSKIRSNIMDHNSYVAAIDLEPNPAAPNDIVRNIVIKDNTMFTYTHYVNHYDDLEGRSTSNIKISGNIGSCNYLFRMSSGVGSEGTVDDVAILSNTIRDPSETKKCRGFLLGKNVRGNVIIKDNFDFGTGDGWFFGGVDTDSFIISSNVIDRSASPSGVGFSIIECNATVSSNRIKLAVGTGVGINANDCSSRFIGNDITAQRGIYTKDVGLRKSSIVGNHFDCTEAGWRGSITSKSDINFDNTNTFTGTALVYSENGLLRYTDPAVIDSRTYIEYADALEDITGNGLEYGRGSMVYNTNPAAGSNIGWVCVTTGTPGVWKTFGAIEV